MNKESVKVNITCAGGRVEEVESDAIYGCAVTEDKKRRCSLPELLHWML